MTAAYLPAAHSTQSELLSLPATDEGLEDGQKMQEDDPADGLKLPGTHARQSKMLDPENPGLHAQDERAVLPGGEVEYRGQLVHTTLPTDGL